MVAAWRGLPCRVGYGVDMDVDVDVDGVWCGERWRVSGEGE